MLELQRRVSGGDYSVYKVIAWACWSCNTPVGVVPPKDTNVIAWACWSCNGFPSDSSIPLSFVIAWACWSCNLGLIRFGFLLVIRVIAWACWSCNHRNSRSRSIRAAVIAWACWSCNADFQTRLSLLVLVIAWACWSCNESKSQNTRNDKPRYRLGMLELQHEGTSADISQTGKLSLGHVGVATIFQKNNVKILR